MLSLGGFAIGQAVNSALATTALRDWTDGPRAIADYRKGPSGDDVFQYNSRQQPLPPLVTPIVVGKEIKLTPKGAVRGTFPGKDSMGPMICQNKNFLKLICQGKNTAFSMSLTNSKEREMAVRFSAYDPKTGGFIHTHGNINEPRN